MNQPLTDRRRFLRLTGGLTLHAVGGLLLSGCGGGGGSAPATATASEPVAVVTAPTAVPPIAMVPVTGAAAAINLLLNLEYVGAQFYAHAATGSGLASASLSGVGTPGVVTGTRQATLTDAGVAQAATEIAAARALRVTVLRSLAGAGAAAQPAIDLSPGGAFAGVASRAGVGGFDPFAGDAPFLLGAALMEHLVAAAYRGVMMDPAAEPALQSHLSEAVYHGSLIRSLLDARADGDATLGTTATALFKQLAHFDGSDTGDQSLAMADTGASATMMDGADRPIPFLRTSGQVLLALQLGSPTAGGFLPSGANAVRATA